MTEYDDFIIQIQPAVEGEHRVVVIESTAGKRASRNVRIETSDADGAGHPPARVRDETLGLIARDARRSSIQASSDPREEGARLFDSLFTGDVREYFVQSLGTATSNKRRLRIRLQFDVNDPSLAALATLPWELMYHRSRNDFLVLSSDFTVVRELTIPSDGYIPRPISGPVRVLFVMADPTDTLDLDEEVEDIKRSLAEFRDADFARTQRARRQIDATYLPRATFEDFERKLALEDYHIIHFMGHGVFDASHRGQLLFQDRAISSTAVATVLKKERMTRLVTLNACRTGQLSASEGADPFAGVASAIVMAGIPAVVAMQFPVSDKAAIAFGARLYSELERGEPIEAAVDSGRLKMMALAPEDREWATPVLFVRDVSPFIREDFVGGAIDVEMVPPAPRTSRNTPARADAVADPWGPRTDDTFRIFVGETSEMQSSLRAKVIKGLRTSGVQIETIAPPNEDEDDAARALQEHRRQVTALVRGADLCLFVFGASTGQPFEDDAPLQTFPVEPQRSTDVSRTRRPLCASCSDRRRGCSPWRSAASQWQVCRWPRGARRARRV